MGGVGVERVRADSVLFANSIHKAFICEEEITELGNGIISIVTNNIDTFLMPLLII